MQSSPLSLARLEYKPKLPIVLHQITSLHPFIKEKFGEFLKPEIEKFFPHISKNPFLFFSNKMSMAYPSMPLRPLKVGVVLSGGQAAGGHNVISGLLDALHTLHPESKLIGFLDGPSGVIYNQYKELTKEVVAPYRNQGGFTIIGSGRTKWETPEQFAAVAETLKKHSLDGLVVVGGDDSNTNAALLAEYCRHNNIKTSIIGVPKTIDGDLKSRWIETSFGFDTASKVYAETIGNLAQDALSAKKYYFFVKIMGRSASHLALECALQTQVNLTFIGEEIAAKKMTLAEIVTQTADLVCKRSALNKNYGVILIPEGLLEAIPECEQMIRELNTLEPSQKNQQEVQKHLSPSSLHCFSLFPTEIQQQLLLDLDPHGNIEVSKIETERLLISLVKKELSQRKNNGTWKGSFNPQPLFCGYEGRSALPSNFDSQYCYALGHLAALLTHHGASGYMCSISGLAGPVENWELCGVPLVQLLHFEIRKNKRVPVIQKALVNLGGAPFTTFKKKRVAWELEDHYLSPGPIQFEGPLSITNASTLTLLLETLEAPASKPPLKGFAL